MPWVPSPEILTYGVRPGHGSLVKLSGCLKYAAKLEKSCPQVYHWIKPSQQRKVVLTPFLLLKDNVIGGHRSREKGE